MCADLPAARFTQTLAQNLYLEQSARGFIVTGSNVGEFKVRRDGRIQMLATLEINIALWGMIISAAMEAAHFF
jgi:hypothetical protein